MKTVELEPSLVEDIKALLADEEMKEKFLRSIRRFRAKMVKREAEVKAEDLTPYTMEEIDAMIEEGEADIAAGRVMTSEQVFREMEEKYPWLRK